MENKQFGKREMFCNIQRQMIAIEQKGIEDKYLALKSTMVGLEQVLQVEEEINGIAIDCEVDNDIIEHSKSISRLWKKQIDNIQDK